MLFEKKRIYLSEESLSRPKTRHIQRRQKAEFHEQKQ
jgi:hypothetical protein